MGKGTGIKEIIMNHILEILRIILGFMGGLTLGACLSANDNGNAKLVQYYALLSILCLFVIIISLT